MTGEYPGTLSRKHFNNFGNMKPLAMQGINGHGTDLSGSRFSNGINEVIMDISNDMYPEDNSNLRREESSIISNLPLLFANGHPTSLEKITMVPVSIILLDVLYTNLYYFQKFL